MRIPNISCKIEMLSSVNSSEDPNKIKIAISNIFPYSTIKTESYSISAISKELQSFEKIYQAIHNNRFQKVFSRYLEKNLENDTTWFYLNKQAAFVEKIVICEEAEESPLGPIKTTITSSNIDEIINWMVYEN
ncbi:MAG: hypothetical protein OEY17_07350 [Nitrosopumilus sp.]|nr:hypothetical protein [Nitrosopumilus sp.]